MVPRHSARTVDAVRYAGWSSGPVDERGTCHDASTSGAGAPDRNHRARRTKAGTARAVSLIQYCTAWTKVIERMPPAPTARAMTTMTTKPPTHAGRPRHEGQRQARALELRQEIEPPDGDDEHRRHEPDRPRPQPRLGEVGKGVRPGASHRGGHDDEQHEVAHGVADRQPQHVDPTVVHQPSDAEEARGGEVLAADGRGVEAGRHGAAGHVEVARAPREAQARDRRRRGW